MLLKKKFCRKRPFAIKIFAEIFFFAKNIFYKKNGENNISIE